MCGVVGVLAPVADDLEADLGRSLSLMRHRGPDDAGTVRGEDVGIGMVRLRVRSGVDDAVPFRDGGRAYALNGEIYARWEDGRAVPVAGGAEEGRVATEPHGCPDGMWAVIALDDDGTVSVGRDPWGIKPLWLRRWSDARSAVGPADDEVAYMVASSVAPLLATGVRPGVRREAVAQFLACGQVVDGGSFWEDVRQIPPGATSLTDTVAVPPRARLADVWCSTGSAVEAAVRDRRLDELIRGSVRRGVAATLEADRPVGLALSGGLDSTIVAFHARELGYADLATVSVLVEGEADGLAALDDLQLPGATPPGWRHHVGVVGPSNYLDLVRRAVVELGQPTSLTSVPLYLALADAAADAGIVALLVGEGADEVWGGYRSYLEVTPDTTTSAFYTTPGRWRAVGDLVGRAPTIAARRALERRLPVGTGGPAIREAERLLSLGPLLERTDALTMARSIEARTPFLHAESWAIADRLPWEALVRDGQTKVALRAAYARQLPAFRQERKTAFRAPWGRWLSTDLGREVAEEIAASHPALTELGLDLAAVDRVVAAGRAGSSDAAAMTFSLLTLALWSAAS